MYKLIDKEALVTEIERRLEELYSLLPNASKVENGMITISEACNTGKYTALESFKDYVNTLEVKEVDLEEDVDKILEEYDWNYDKIDFYKFAKHFFELGLSVSNKAQKG